jgi:hypothetical protein
MRQTSDELPTVFLLPAKIAATCRRPKSHLLKKWRPSNRAEAIHQTSDGLSAVDMPVF